MGSEHASTEDLIKQLDAVQQELNKYKGSMRQIAELLDLKLKKNPDGSKVKVTCTMVVDEVRKVHDEFIALSQTNSTSCVVAANLGSSTVGVKRQRESDTVDLDQAVSMDCVDGEDMKQLISDEKLKYIESLPRFPDKYGLSKLKTFINGDGQAMVTLGYKSSKSSSDSVFATVACSRSKLLDTSVSLDDLLGCKTTYRTEWVAEQVGSMKDLVTYRVKRMFWDNFGGEPRKLMANLGPPSNAKWKAVSIIDYHSNNRKYPVIVEQIGLPIVGRHRRLKMPANYALFRELSA